MHFKFLENGCPPLKKETLDLSKLRWVLGALSSLRTVLLGWFSELQHGVGLTSKGDSSYCHIGSSEHGAGRWDGAVCHCRHERQRGWWGHVNWPLSEGRPMERGVQARWREGAKTWSRTLFARLDTEPEAGAVGADGTGAKWVEVSELAEGPSLMHLPSIKPKPLLHSKCVQMTLSLFFSYYYFLN